MSNFFNKFEDSEIKSKNDLVYSNVHFYFSKFNNIYYIICSQILIYLNIKFINKAIK